MERLISNTDFGFYVRELEINDHKKLELRESYDFFLKQPLTLEMFVPCDLEGIVINQCDEICACECDQIKLYREAKERVLFEGFHSFMNNVSNGVFELSLETFWFSEAQENGIVYGQSKIIEDLIYHNLVLTESANKQIGL